MKSVSERRYSRAEVLRVYAEHPLNAARILQRLRAQKRLLPGISEADLAKDEMTGITDQNHIGGTEFVLTLAKKVEIHRGTRVLDLGCGLGGSARVLASNLGCHVHGIDFSPLRHADAVLLTKLAKLNDLVTFECASFLTAKVVPSSFDILWGQSAWVHILDRVRFVRRWHRALRVNGRIAMEDVFLVTSAIPPSKRALLLRLERQWKSYLSEIEEWKEIFRGQSLSISITEDLTSAMDLHFRTLLAVSDHRSVPRAEVQAWEDAIRLIDCGVLCYGRIVARKLARTCD